MFSLLKSEHHAGWLAFGVYVGDRRVVHIHLPWLVLKTHTMT